MPIIEEKKYQQHETKKTDSRVLEIHESLQSDFIVDWLS